MTLTLMCMCTLFKWLTKYFQLRCRWGLIWHIYEQYNFIHIYDCSHSAHKMSSEASETGESKRLPSDGGRIHPQSGATQASRGKAWGKYDDDDNRYVI